MFEDLSKAQLIRIAAEGGGFRTDCGARDGVELMHIAAAAGRSGAKLVFTNVGHLSHDELIRIAVAARGNVFFDDARQA